MASPARSSATRTAAAPPPIGLLTDDLLAEILLRLPTLADIGRAFLRRLRFVHAGPLLGALGILIHPAELPHYAALYARAFAGGADLSFSFLPPGHWYPLDARDGRVLLELSDSSRNFIFAVCDLLSRRYSLPPQIPVDPASMPFLVPASDE